MTKDFDLGGILDRGGGVDPYKLGVWFNFPLWSCSIKLWFDRSTVCGVGCPIKLWFDHSIVCGVGCPINSDVKSDVIVAGVKARRMVQLPTLELSFLFFIRNLKEDTVDKDFDLDFRNKPRLSYDEVRLGETLSKRLWCTVL